VLLFCIVVLFHLYSHCICQRRPQQMRSFCIYGGSWFDNLYTRRKTGSKARVFEREVLLSVFHRTCKIRNQVLTSFLCIGGFLVCSILIAVLCPACGVFPFVSFREKQSPASSFICYAVVMTY